MSLKVQVLAVCCESGPVTVSRLFESVKAWHMLSCNTTVFIEFAVTLSTTTALV